MSVEPGGEQCEAAKVRLRYERRRSLNEADLYNPCSPARLMESQEKERALIRWIRTCGIAPVQRRRLLEIGCGNGGNLLQFIRLGFQPENLVGNELRRDVADVAAHRLPAATRIIVGDAAALSMDLGTFDVVYQSTVFTSLLDDAYQHRVADRMWSLVTPGGGVLWYDSVYDNPFNRDVRGVPLRRIRALFPEGRMKAWRVTLAPPISRCVTRVHPELYTILNALLFLRTHVLSWIRKQCAA